MAGSSLTAFFLLLLLLLSPDFFLPFFCPPAPEPGVPSSSTQESAIIFECCSKA
jgi:hypothetical protein